MSDTTAAEAIRIVRHVDVEFPTGPPSWGSAFIVAPGKLITCAHVVLNAKGEKANKVVVRERDGTRHAATVGAVSRQHDLASLNAPSDNAPAPNIEFDPVKIGRAVIFAGQPQGIRRPAVFPGIVSDTGTKLISKPRCEMIQLAGMINNGNSGGRYLMRREGT